MTRAYLRLDPRFDEKKDDYPDGAYRALIATFCMAESQPERGTFRSPDFLSRLLGKRGRWVAYMIEHNDIEVREDGRVYVVGWNEWQEGDWKVAERVERIRARSRNGGSNGPGNGGVTVSRKAVAVSGAVSEAVSGGDARDPANAYQERTGRYPTPKMLAWIDELAKSAGGGDRIAGDRRLAALIDATPMAGDNPSGYLTLISDNLRREDREANRVELAEEVIRNEAKRAPVVLRAVPDDLSEEEIQRQVDEYREGTA